MSALYRYPRLSDQCIGGRCHGAGVEYNIVIVKECKVLSHREENVKRTGGNGDRCREEAAALVHWFESDVSQGNMCIRQGYVMCQNIVVDRIL